MYKWNQKETIIATILRNSISQVTENVKIFQDELEPFRWIQQSLHIFQESFDPVVILAQISINVTRSQLSIEHKKCDENPSGLSTSHLNYKSSSAVFFFFSHFSRIRLCLFHHLRKSLTGTIRWWWRKSVVIDLAYIVWNSWIRGVEKATNFSYICTFWPLSHSLRTKLYGQRANKFDERKRSVFIVFTLFGGKKWFSTWRVRAKACWNRKPFFSIFDGMMSLRVCMRFFPCLFLSLTVILSASATAKTAVSKLRLYMIHLHFSFSNIIFFSRERNVLRSTPFSQFEQKFLSKKTTLKQNCRHIHINSLSSKLNVSFYRSKIKCIQWQNDKYSQLEFINCHVLHFNWQ